MSEQLGLTPIAPNTPGADVPLKLSSAVVMADCGPSLDLDSDHLLRLKLSISVRVLGGMTILLATTDDARGGAVNSAEEMPGAERLTLRIIPILLSSLPGVLQIAGRSLGPQHDDVATWSYTLTLTFSDGGDIAQSWSTTFEVPCSPLVNSGWHLNVPFNHSLMPAAPPSSR